MVDTATPLPARPETGSLDDLAQRIKTYHAGVLEAARNVVVKAISAGLLLKEAKGKVPHGEWLSWLDEHCELSERTAHRYMQLAANKSKIDDALRGKSATMACTRFRRHRVRCFDGAGGGSWRDGSLRGSSSLRLCA
jgi:hypothetical protein